MNENDRIRFALLYELLKNVFVLEVPVFFLLFPDFYRLAPPFHNTALLGTVVRRKLVNMA